MMNYVELVLQVPVNSEEEARKVIESAYNGLAADAIRLVVLHGLSSTPSVVAAPAKAEKPASTTKVGKAEHTTSALKPGVSKVPREKSTERSAAPRGLAGRRRLGRA